MSPGPPDTPRWSPTGSPALQLGLCTFGILALELATIRWLSGQVRLFAYFQNMVLMAAFLGMGIGVAVGRKRPDLFRWGLPVLAVLAGLMVSSESIGLMHLRFPDPSLYLWGAETQEQVGLLQFGATTLLVGALFWLVVSVFALLAVPVGYLFHELPPLTAYSADLIGSLLGVIAMAFVAALGTPPVVWFAVALLPFLFLSRRPLGLVCAAGVLVFAFASTGGAQFSPYNRIDLEPNPVLDGQPGEWLLSVNRDYHQDVLNLSTAARVTRQRAYLGSVYDFPFRVHAGGGRALIVGAGTGNDVAAALRCGYQEVVSVEIDPTILELGRALHPERPYADPRVHPAVTDARAWFQQHPQERFDVVCYGLLDSHAMFSSMSSLRLDNYVYTLEGLRAGWSHVNEGGILSVSFAIGAPWIQDRLWMLLVHATGQEPIVIRHGMNHGVVFLVGRQLNPEDVPPTFTGPGQRPPDREISIPTDDWPFLYLKPGAAPKAYLAVLGLILISSFFVIRRVFRAEDGASDVQRFNPAMFFLGAAFMLLETRMVTALSLLFGSTWIVNVSVFGGILSLVLVANVLVAQRTPKRIAPWFVPLLLSLVFLYLLPLGALNQLPLGARLLVSGLVFALPVGFAGVVFATLLKRSTSASAALGSNLIGAVAGGLVEYSSMLLGLRALLILAGVFYVAAWVLLPKSEATPAPAAPEPTAS